MVDSAMFRSIGFGLKNVDNTKKGHPVKSAVAAGQIRNATVELNNYESFRNCFNEICVDVRKAVEGAQKADGLVGKTANTAVHAYNSIAKETKLFEYTGKALNWAGNHVNPLICVSAGVDVALSDDKEKTFVENSMGLGAMFGTERLMKTHLDKIVTIKGVDTIAEKAMKFASNYKYGKHLPAVAHGLAFIVGSCAAYCAGQGVGNMLMGGDKKEISQANQQIAIA